VLQASTGQDAVRISAEQGPDLVLLDLGLPDMDGLEVARRLKADGRTRAVPVVALTGRAMDADVEACRAAGCSGYFLKPVDAAKLLGAIPTYLPSPA